VKECELFINLDICGPLFGFSKNKISSTKSFMGFTNSLLNNWGLKICVDTKFTSIRINKIKKNIRKNL
jgi:hypothetical protein